MAKASNGIFVDCNGKRVTGLNDLTTVPRPNSLWMTPIPPGTTFPNGHVIPSDFMIDVYWRYVSSSRGVIGADGEAVANIGWPTVAFINSSYVMQALLNRPLATFVLDPPYQALPRVTQLDRDNDVLAYRTFANTFDINDPAQVAEANDWVAKAHGAAYTAMGGRLNTLYFATITLAHVSADHGRILADPRVTLSMHTV